MALGLAMAAAFVVGFTAGALVARKVSMFLARRLMARMASPTGRNAVAFERVRQQAKPCRAITGGPRA